MIPLRCPQSKASTASVLTYVLLSLGCSFFFQCDLFSTQNRTTSPIIARVGKAVLTLDDVNKSIPSEYSNTISQKQRINYVKQWIDTELLFQEAQRRNIHKEKVIRERLNQMQKDLLSAEMVSRNSTDLQKQTITEEAMRNYYEQNKNTFIRESDVVKYLEIEVENLSIGWNLRNQLTPKNFIELGNQNSSVPMPDPQTITYTPIQNLPPEITSALSTTKINGITTPIKTAESVHILLLLDKQKAGETCLFEEVKDEVYNLLSTQMYKSEIEELLVKLKQKTDNEFHVELIMQDTTTITETTIDTAIYHDSVKIDTLIGH